eukprot:c7525_g1_i1.p1 GENE.c7525_g1_i1~~c7525_g1_i1.p1  ORF type:complete len:449 (-),score=141.41 c7525_g1_i1:141-1487(-)
MGDSSMSLTWRNALKERLISAFLPSLNVELAKETLQHAKESTDSNCGVMDGGMKLDQAQRTQLVGQSFQLLLDELLGDYSSGAKQLTEVPLKEFIETMLWACKESIVDIVSLLVTMEDLFNALAVSDCSHVFAYLELHREEISQALKACQSSWGELTMLRFCGDLLRRVSKCVHAEFSGRVLCFLACMLDLTARSGVNIASAINEDNTTWYEDAEPDLSALDSRDPATKQDDKDVVMEEGETIDDDNPTTPLIDFVFYQKLWSLQRFLHNPDVTLGPSESWKELQRTVDTILNAFASYSKQGMSVSASKPFYSTKFLSSSALLKQQLSDAGFRQHLLVQLWIFLHTLTNKVREKGPNLTATHQTWVRDTTARVSRILSRTGHNGQSFCSTMKLLLQREENWIAWKSEKPKVCPPFEKYFLDPHFVHPSFQDTPVPRPLTSAPLSLRAS